MENGAAALAPALDALTGLTQLQLCANRILWQSLEQMVFEEAAASWH
jgi:hypothetical protein